jgi:hypothetical protein
VFYGLTVGWFFFRQPDWMLVYLRDAREVPLLPAYLVFLLILAAFGAFGALANSALLLRGHRGPAWGLTIAAMLTLASTFYLQWPQYLVVGTYEQYLAGQAPPLDVAPGMQRAMNVSGALSAAGALGLFVLRFLQARRA